MLKNVLVLGATGFTGRLICSHFLNQNINFVAAGRGDKELNDLYPGNETAVMDIMDKSRLNDLMKNTDIIVNAVGPFNIYGYKAIQSAAEHGVHYLDITGEQHFVKFAFDEIDKIAKENHSLIITSCSFESLIADLMAAKTCQEDEDYENISSFYHFDRSHPSSGTKLTMQLTKYFNTYLMKDGALAATPPMGHQLQVEIAGLSEFKYAHFVPLPEVLFFKKQYRVKNVGSYYLFCEDQSGLGALEMGRSKKTLVTTMERFQRRKTVNPTVMERKDQTFIVAVVSRSTGGVQRQIVVKGKDMYDLTAKIVAHCVKILSNIKVENCGVRTPAEVFSDQALLNTLVQSNHFQLL